MIHRELRRYHTMVRSVPGFKDRDALMCVSTNLKKAIIAKYNDSPFAASMFKEMDIDDEVYFCGTRLHHFDSLPDAVVVCVVRNEAWVDSLNFDRPAFLARTYYCQTVVGDISPLDVAEMFIHTRAARNAFAAVGGVVFQSFPVLKTGNGES